MPVDKFGRTDSRSTQRVIAGGVTLTQVNNTFARLDGTNAFTGNLNIGGNSIEGLSTTYTPSEDNHLTNKKYVDRRIASNATRDYVSGMKVSPGNLVRNTTSGIIYRFEGTAGPITDTDTDGHDDDESDVRPTPRAAEPITDTDGHDDESDVRPTPGAVRPTPGAAILITVAPALSPNWRPTTGAAICSLREAEEGRQIGISAGSQRAEAMRDKLTTIVINTDSAYTTANGLITIPRTGIYRLGGFVSIARAETRVRDLRVSYSLAGNDQNELTVYKTQYSSSSAVDDITTMLPCPVAARGGCKGVRRTAVAPGGTSRGRHFGYLEYFFGESVIDSFVHREF